MGILFSNVTLQGGKGEEKAILFFFTMVSPRWVIQNPLHVFFWKWSVFVFWGFCGKGNVVFHTGWCVDFAVFEERAKYFIVKNSTKFADWVQNYGLNAKFLWKIILSFKTQSGIYKSYYFSKIQCNFWKLRGNFWKLKNLIKNSNDMVINLECTIIGCKNTIQPIKPSEASTLFCVHAAVQPECMNQQKPRAARISMFWSLL